LDFGSWAKNKFNKIVHSKDVSDESDH